MTPIKLILVFLLISYIFTYGIIPFEKINAPYEHVTHKVFIDIQIEEDPPKRIHFALFGKVMPKMVENFRALCTGEKGYDKKTGARLHYKGTQMHRIQRYSWIEGGDVLHTDSDEGVSIYGSPFYADNYNLGHNGMGYLGMRMGDITKDSFSKTFTSIFYITSRLLDHFDNKHAVFGKVLYEEERLWLRNVTRYFGNEMGYKHWKYEADLIFTPHIEIIDSGELKLDGNEDQILNPDLHRKEDL